MSYHITLLPGRIYSDIECFFFFLKDKCHLLHSFFYNTLIEICNSYAIKFPLRKCIIQWVLVNLQNFASSPLILGYFYQFIKKVFYALGVTP